MMAYRCMKVFVNGTCDENHVRTFGGNGKNVRNMVNFYNNMTKEQFLFRHPKFEELCKDNFKLYVFYS